MSWWLPGLTRQPIKQNSGPKGPSSYFATGNGDVRAQLAFRARLLGLFDWGVSIGILICPFLLVE